MANLNILKVEMVGPTPSRTGIEKHVVDGVYVVYNGLVSYNVVVLVIWEFKQHTVVVGLFVGNLCLRELQLQCCHS